MPKYNKKIEKIEEDEIIISGIETTKNDEETFEVNTTEEIIKPQEKETTVKSSVCEVRYREVVYLGVANEAERVGVVTGNIYIFKKDIYRMPETTQVDERDYLGLISEKGRGCARKDASILFMSKLEWDLELEQARIANSA